ncbi:hypothetical protein GCM10022236_34020 [Microlunatus ginsengisoli]|jgi:excisionase family DNA binding protein|uniref:Helix-turn-helix domain-containing protein n=1 Tax=Microlunatus ginsengisoli TaxID=363863 RepID=A0ABP7ABM2_9ACTN
MAAVGTDKRGSPDSDHEAPRHPGFDIANADTWPEMLTVDELALILRSSTKAVREMIANGQIEAMRGAGRGFRISKRWVITHILRDSP